MLRIISLSFLLFSFLFSLSLSAQDKMSSNDFMKMLLDKSSKQQVLKFDENLKSLTKIKAA